MNDPSPPPPDWESIFHQARRRMAGRLLLVAVIAAGGTMLLLGGGLQAQGAISLPVPGMNGSHRQGSERHEKRGDHHRHQEQQGSPKHEQQDRHKKQGDDNKQNHPPKHCTEKSETSSEGEYGRWEVPNSPAGNKCPSA